MSESILQGEQLTQHNGFEVGEEVKLLYNSMLYSGTLIALEKVPVSGNHAKVVAEEDKIMATVATDQLADGKISMPANALRKLFESKPEPSSV